MNSIRGRVSRHCRQLAMDERLATDKQQIADVVFDTDVDDVPCFLQGHASALLGIEPVDRKTAKVAFCVANVGNGELQIARPAMIQYVPKQFEDTRFRT